MISLAFAAAVISSAHAQGAPAPAAGTHAHAISLPAVPTDNRLLGVWGGDLSTAVVRFAVSEGRLWVDAWDSHDGEWFVLREPKRQGEALLVTSTMPSTNWTLSNSWSWEPTGLRWVFSGDASGNDVSRRVDKAPLQP
ncbi:hypothetical protein LBMAG42_49990 [Deltaproteobacteria bacterium]|nr:hypothetical protein LBMAG42_49990 [Deltaproteobacteria bacterium]